MNRSGTFAPLRRSRVGFAVLAAALIAAGSAVFVWRMGRPGTEQLLREARIALDRNNTAVAVYKLDEILRRNPSHGMALLYRGQLERDAGNLDDALRHWAAVPNEPSRTAAMARYFQGTLLLEKHLAREAEKNLVEAIVRNPDYLPPHERLLELYVAQMRRNSIRETLNSIGRIRPWKIDELVMYAVAGERVTPIDDGVKLMQGFLAADPGDLTSGLALARFFMSGDRTADALALLGRLQEQFSSDERISALQSEMLLDRHDITSVQELLGRVPLRGTSHVSMWQSVGRYWFESGNWQNAAGALLEVATRDPENLAARYQLGTALSRLGRQEEGTRHLKRAELLDKLQREVLRIPRRDRRQTGALLPIVLDAARLMVEVDRFVEGVWWYEQAEALDPANETARLGLERAIQLASSVASPTPPARGAAADEIARQVRVPASPGQSKLAVTAPPTASRKAPISLRDVGAEAGLDYQYFSGQTGLKYLVESMGGAVAVIDYDGDGWPDLYFAQGCALPYDAADTTHLDRLYRNRGDGTFEDVSLQSGLGDNRYGQGCAVGDFDNDGDPDLFLANFGSNVFYLNNGDGTFTDITDEANVALNKWSSSAAFADLDRDGNLDLYVVTYVDSLKVCRADGNRITTCDPQNFNAEQDVLYRNRGDGTMQDISDAAGIRAPDGKGLGIVVADLDGDGWSDIYVANDGTPNFLFHNLGAADGLRFREEGLVSGAALSGDGQAEASMGIACSDLNGDRLPDLFVTNFYLETATLYVNQGGGLFLDGTRAAGLDAPTKYVLGFGTQAIDFDRDGWPDLIVANGHIDDYRFRNEPWKMAPQLFQNLGFGQFSDVSAATGSYFKGEYLGRGVARLDWNRDGLPDAVIVHQDRPVALLKNETTPAGHGLVVELHGVTSNRDAIGAKLRVTAGEREQVLEVCGGDGFFCSNERRQFIGLGNADLVQVLEVDWPEGGRQRWTDIPADCLVILVEGQPLRIQRRPEFRPTQTI